MELGAGLGHIDWKTVIPNLPKFDKNFYIEHDVTAARDDTEVTEFRAKNKISIYGRDVPKPILSFHEANFPGIPPPAREARLFLF